MARAAFSRLAPSRQRRIAISGAAEAPEPEGAHALAREGSQLHQARQSGAKRRQCSTASLPRLTCACQRCPQMFTKTGQASKVNLIAEIGIGLTMGTALGFWWQT